MNNLLAIIDPFLSPYALTVLMIVSIALMIYGVRGLTRKKPVTVLYEPEIKRDWTPTGRVNAVADDPIMASDFDNIPAAFVILVEEDRMIADIGGDAIVEKRWRAATRNEVRKIVSRYHSMWQSQDMLRTASPFGTDTPPRVVKSQSLPPIDGVMTEASASQPVMQEFDTGVGRFTT